MQVNTPIRGNGTLSVCHKPKAASVPALGRHMIRVLVWPCAVIAINCLGRGQGKSSILLLHGPPQLRHTPCEFYGVESPRKDISSLMPICSLEAHCNYRHPLALSDDSREGCTDMAGPSLLG